MSQDIAAQILYNTMITILVLSMPTVGAGLLVGFIISLFQAVTQIQEQTLTFVPKVITVLLVFAFTAPWFFSLLFDFTSSLWATIPNMTK